MFGDVDCALFDTHLYVQHTLRLYFEFSRAKTVQSRHHHAIAGRLPEEICVKRGAVSLMIDRHIMHVDVDIVRAAK